MLQTNDPEAALYEAVVADPGAVEPLRRYRDWLAAQSDARLPVVAGLLAALQGGGPPLVPDATAWGVGLGIPLAQALAERGHSDALPALLSCSRLGLEMVFGTPSGSRTRFFGDPDLPPVLPWPTHGDCLMWEPLPQVDAALPCRFVCQLDLADLRVPGLPTFAGLLSVFVFQEYDEFGSAGVVVHQFPPDVALEVRPHPECDEANERLEPEGVCFRRVRMLPCGSGGPWSAVAEAHKEAWEVGQEATESLVFGALGHLRATTGDDPTPSLRHHRLLVAPCDPEGLLNLHLAIEEAALRAGRLTELVFAWVDFDGA